MTASVACAEINKALPGGTAAQPAKFRHRADRAAVWSPCLSSTPGCSGAWVLGLTFRRENKDQGILVFTEPHLCYVQLTRPKRKASAVTMLILGTGEH